MPPTDSPPLNHAEILGALQRAFPGGVFLLARLADPSLALGDDNPHVFIPDTHIVPGADVKKWPGSVLTPSRFDALAALLDSLESLRRPKHGLTVWQLGDLIDLWRIGTAELSMEKRLRRVEADWGKLLSRFDSKGKLPIVRLFGNHDEGLHRLGLSEKAYVPRDPGHTASNDMLVAHGHQFDPVEDLPEEIKAFFMRGLTERITRYTQDLILSANPNWNQLPPDYSFTPPPRPRPEDRDKFLCADLRLDDPVPLLPARWNVQEVKLSWRPDANPFEVDANRGTKWQDDRHPALWDRAKQRAQEAGAAGYSVALVVVGHTHNPRIVVGRYPNDQPIVLMDCGGWIGPRYLAPALDVPIHSCHLGVRVGADLRIYQLGRDPYDWPG